MQYNKGFTTPFPSLQSFIFSNVKIDWQNENSPNLKKDTAVPHYLSGFSIQSLTQQ